MDIRTTQKLMAENNSTHYYNDQLRDIFGKSNIVNINNQYQAKMTYMYALQMIDKDPDVTFAQVQQHASERIRYLEQNGFSAVVADKKGEDPTEHNKKKGWKAIKAKELYLKHRKEYSRKQFIELFVKEVDMTPAGASTYHANLKKQCEV